jgi:hypothetical protein
LREFLTKRVIDRGKNRAGFAKFFRQRASHADSLTSLPRKNKSAFHVNLPICTTGLGPLLDLWPKSLQPALGLAKLLLSV